MDLLLINKRNELEAIISAYNPNIIALTELMPKNAKNIDTNELFNINNYDKFINKQPHRGVIIYTRHSLKATEITFDNNNDFHESVTCEITTTVPGVSLLFACVYRSPHSDRDNNDKILKLLKDIDNHPAKLKCITGDFICQVLTGKPEIIEITSAINYMSAQLTYS